MSSIQYVIHSEEHVRYAKWIDIFSHRPINYNAALITAIFREDGNGNLYTPVVSIAEERNITQRKSSLTEALTRQNVEKPKSKTDRQRRKQDKQIASSWQPGLKGFTDGDLRVEDNVGRRD